MNTKKDQTEPRMSFALWTLACGVSAQAQGLAHASVRQVWMHPQSKGGPVLGLRSRRALSPVPQPEHERRQPACHRQKQRRN